MKTFSVRTLKEEIQLKNILSFQEEHKFLLDEEINFLEKFIHLNTLTYDIRTLQGQWIKPENTFKVIGKITNESEIENNIEVTEEEVQFLLNGLEIKYQEVITNGLLNYNLLSIIILKK